mmetsp:Transcript_20518/g.44309  ORF Transcript_20518/g.44309 Transcript_20518/m.44309 type:complete len:116 (+) Transcript_20518:1654-2001(+)
MITVLNNLLDVSIDFIRCSSVIKNCTKASALQQFVSYCSLSVLYLLCKIAVPSSSITQLSSLLLLLSLTSSGGGVWCGTSFPPNGFTIVVVARLTLFFNEYENQIPACVAMLNES